MTKRLVWIGVLSLVCAVVSAGPVIEAQNRSNRGAGSNGRAAQPQLMGHNPGPKAAAPKGETSSGGQHPGGSAQTLPSSTAKLPLAGAAQPHPSGVVPAQTSGVSPTPPPQSNQLFESNLHGMNSLAVSRGSDAQTQPSTAGTLKTNSQNQTLTQNQTATQNQTPTPASKEEQKPTKGRKPWNGVGPPKQPTTLNTQNPNPNPTQNPNQTDKPYPALPKVYPPPGWPRPMTLPSFPSQQVLQTNRNLQPGPAVSYSPGVQDQPPPASIADPAPNGSQAKASPESPTSSPPQQDPPKPDQSGPQQNRDEGKVAMNRHKRAQHDVKPARSTVTNQPPSSVRPAVGKKTLVTVSLASMAGVGFWILHMLLNVTTGCRWDVPKVTVVGPQPYVSLSFVPDMGPAEERITFLKTKRRSG
jgi:hypothetical protein